MVAFHGTPSEKKSPHLAGLAHRIPHQMSEKFWRTKDATKASASGCSRFIWHTSW